MIELFLFKTRAFYHFWYNSSHILANKFTITLTDDQFCKFTLMLIKKKVFKTEIIYCMRNFMIKSLYLSFKDLKVVINHLSQNLSFFFIRANILVSYFLHVFYCVACMYFFTFKMMLDTTFCLAYCTRTLAGQTAAYLNSSKGVYFTQCIFASVHYIMIYNPKNRAKSKRLIPLSK